MSGLSLGQQMCRTAGIFQGITAVPVMLVQGDNAFEELSFYYSYLRLYYFITAACTGLMAAAILFLIVVGRSARNTKVTTYYVEIVKSSLATALWLWLLLDSIFGPRRRAYNQPDPRPRRIAESVICFFVLPVLFYPTLIFAFHDKNTGEGVEDEEENIPTERDPLLQAH